MADYYAELKRRASLGYRRFCWVPEIRRYALGFDRTWSVQTFGSLAFEQDVYDTLREDFGPSTAKQYKRSCGKAHWHGATIYEYGERKPNYPVPATIRDSASNLGFRWSNWIDHAPQTKP